MMEIRTCGIDTIESVIEEFKPDSIVSLLQNPKHHHGIALPLIEIPVRFIAQFSDAIKAVLSIEADRLLIHCRYGEGRSAAIAIAKLYQQGPDMVDRYLRENQNVKPNPLLLLLADDILDADFDLLRRCRGRWPGSKHYTGRPPQ